MIEKKLIKAMMDDYKDAEMLYDYAKGCKEHKDKEHAMLFIGWAKKRYDMALEKHKMINNMMDKHEEKEVALYWVLHESIMDEYSQLGEKINTFMA